MPYCEKRGAQIGEGDRFCSKCGASLAGCRLAREEEWRVPWEACFGRRGERDHIGLVSFGLFLLVVGYVWYTFERI
ncbi:MAG: zinc-ribbon domain-containing protein [Candidatus Geothermarchaeales archaeon]